MFLYMFNVLILLAIANTVIGTGNTLLILIGVILIRAILAYSGFDKELENDFLKGDDDE